MKGNKAAAPVSAAMKKARSTIDHADMALLKALSQRFSAVADIGKIKRREGLPLIQKKRWKEIIDHRVSAGDRIGLNREFVKAVFEAIHKESIRVQKLIQKSSRSI